MKRITLPALITVLVLLFAFTSNTKFPSQIIKPRLEQQITTFKTNISIFSEEAKNLKTKEIIQNYKALRLEYKAMESYFVYMYPGLNKSINGAPVPSFVTDIVKADADEATGLQVIEELISEKPLDHSAIAKQCKEINLALDEATRLLQQTNIHDWEILEANKMELVQLATVNITGFDSPILKHTLPETKVAFQQIETDILLYAPLLPKNKENLISQAKLLFALGNKQLNAQNDFEQFNRFTFTRDVIEPLYKTILEIHQASGYEQYHETASLPRGFNHLSTGIFQADFLNPYFSARGKQNATPAIQNLGKILFFDPVLSHNNERACASCHQANKGFGDGVAKSIAFDFDGTVDRNSPTLLNAAFQNNFFWDMRSDDLNNQIEFVAHSQKEFNTTFDEIIGKLKQSEEYETLFSTAYPNNPTMSIGKVKEALGAYVRSLVALNSPFDKYMRQEAEAPQEIEEGYNLFMGKAGCGTCHFAPAFNGTTPPFFNDTEGEVLGVPAHKDNKTLDKDQGRYARFKDRYPEMEFLNGLFKTPTVRNAELSAPYMHNGCYTSLEEVVDFYNQGGGLGLGFDVPAQTLPEDKLKLSNKEQTQLIAFMKSLTDTTGLTDIPQKLPYINAELENRIVGGKY